MNESDILLAKPISLEVGGHKFTFIHPTLEWWVEFIKAVGGLFGASQTKGILSEMMKGRQAEQIISLVCQTLNISPKKLKKELTLHQTLALLDKWIDCIGIEEAQSFLKGLGEKIATALPAPKNTP
jgi:hypothetical protein